MPDSTRAVFAAALALVLAAAFTQTALAQSKGRIVCWKDKSGKVVGCGDKVPPEFQDAATKELDRRGVTRKTTETAEEETRRKAQEAAKAQQMEEEKKRLAEQRRRDAVLLNTYANDREIDQRRDRELREVDRLLGQFQGLHKGAAARRDDAQQRLAAAEKTRKPSDAVKDEIARAEAEMTRLEKNIDAKNKEKEEIIARYAQTKRRYLELGGATAQAAPAKK
jgi:predicted ribosome quality control (RQC) complex YloA/Tae2 family protein